MRPHVLARHRRFVDTVDSWTGGRNLATQQLIWRNSRIFFLVLGFHIDQLVRLNLSYWHLTTIFFLSIFHDSNHEKPLDPFETMGATGEHRSSFPKHNDWSVSFAETKISPVVLTRFSVSGRSM